MGRVRAYVGLGANVGDAAGTLEAAIHALAALPGARLRDVSRLYATDPVGVMDQPEFRNAVAALDVPAGPRPEDGALALLVALKGLERAFGRHRIDVERPAEGRSDDPAKASMPLVVPHAESRNRLFVLAPLADLAPGLVPPGWGESVATARDRQLAIEGRDAARPIARWHGARWAATADGGRTSARAGR